MTDFPVTIAAHAHEALVSGKWDAIADLLEGLDVDNTFDDYFAQYRSLNWESSFQVDKRLRLFLNVNNLTDEPQVSYQGFQRTDNPEDVTTYSWRATAGASPGTAAWSGYLPSLWRAGDRGALAWPALLEAMRQPAPFLAVGGGGGGGESSPSSSNVAGGIAAIVEPGSRDGGKLLIAQDGAHRRQVVAGLECEVSTFGFSPEADYQVVYGAADNRVALFWHGYLIAAWNNQMPGGHNALNAAAAGIMNNWMGLDWDDIAVALAEFSGLDRRSQWLGTRTLANGATVPSPTAPSRLRRPRLPAGAADHRP